MWSSCWAAAPAVTACGGATGSSKAHKLTSLETCGAEVQKGNAPIERKLQRLFRREDACRLIKRCNDFGAGGVSVAIGELADGLKIDLNKVTKKYEGLDGTELAISESQERMAVAVAAEDAETFMQYAAEENLEATIVATVTEEKRMRECLERQGHRRPLPRVPELQRCRASRQRAHPQGSCLAAPVCRCYL